MTREEAYKLNTHITGKLQDIRWREAVDSIFDEFEQDMLNYKRRVCDVFDLECSKKISELIELQKSKTCESCKHGVEDYGAIECSLDSGCYLYRGSMPKDYCCNKWEKKDDQN